MLQIPHKKNRGIYLSIQSSGYQKQMKPKKAQVTIFIILGLVLLIVAGLVTYFAVDMFKYADIEEQFIPVAKYTEQCVNDVTEHAIFLAGINGGHIKSQDNEKEAYLDAGFPITYWFIAGEDRSVTIVQLENELEMYLNEHVNDCLTDYSSFEGEFAVTPVNQVSVTSDVRISENEVHVELNLPVQISDGTVTSTLPEIKVKIHNTIGKKLFLAYQIMKTENKDGFLEFYTDEIIAASDWLPYEGFDVTCKPKRWTVNEMREYIKQAIAVNLPFIMFKGTRYEETGDPYYDKIYLVDPHASGVKDLNVDIMYNPEWGMNLDVNPSENGIVTTLHMVGQTIAIPCISVYHHKYSAYFPVLFTITDDDAGDYPFYFATPVIMKRNEADRYSEIQPWPSETDVIRSREYCSKTVKTTAYTMKRDGTLDAQETEEDRWLYDLDVIVMDALYGFDGILDNVSIKYQCGQFICDIGATEYGSGNTLVAYPLLSSRFPSCLHGQIIAEKNGYHAVRASQTVADDTDGATVQMKMFHLRPLNFDITLIENHNNVIGEVELDENDIVVITLKNENLDFEKVMVWPIGNTSEGAAGFDTLELLVAPDVTYELDIKLIQDDIFTGGLSYNWTPDVNTITAANGVHFYAIKKDILLSTNENYMEAMKYAEHESANYPPEFW